MVQSHQRRGIVLILVKTLWYGRVLACFSGSCSHLFISLLSVNSSSPISSSSSCTLVIPGVGYRHNPMFATEERRIIDKTEREVQEEDAQEEEVN